MLRLFRKKHESADPARQTTLDSLKWPFWSALMMRLRPFQGRRFFQGIVSMTAKMAAVDGAISQPELTLFLDLLESHFALSGSQKKEARKVLFQVQHSTKSFTDFAKEFYWNFRSSRPLIENAFDVLLSMAYVDNILSRAEQELLAEAAIIFELSTATIERLTARHHNRKTRVEVYEQTKQAKQKQAHQQERASQQQQEERHQQQSYQEKQERQEQRQQQAPKSDLASFGWASVLGVSPSDSSGVVKRRYRLLVRQYHPDALPKDIPADMLRASTERFLEIQRAYERFCYERGE
jgi:tellurite resistance protein